MVVMAPFTNMPEDVKKIAEATTEAVASGKLHPFHGPIYKQKGTFAVRCCPTFWA